MFLALGIEDVTRIRPYLRDMTPEELIRLGQALGLNRTSLQRCNPQSLAEDLIHYWIRQDYRVLEESGDPTWQSLARALRDVELTGISLRIQRDFNFAL